MKKNIIQAMQVDARNIADIFKLPCVKSIEKSTDGRDVFVKTFTEYAEEGEYIAKRYFVGVETDWVCQLANGKWCILSDEEYKKKMQAL